MNQLEKDLKFGLCGEKNIYEKLKTISSSKISKTLNKFAIMDFESDDFVIELKTRRIKSNTYCDIMIGVNKINYIRETKRRGIIAYQFKDGDYYVEITDDVFNKLRLDIGGVERAGTNDIKKMCYYIPTNILKKF
tara:strand:+ start:1776 stop:2180 length:405 start_codon:yes stop_codon:yes gene_type:complete